MDTKMEDTVFQWPPYDEDYAILRNACIKEVQQCLSKYHPQQVHFNDIVSDTGFNIMQVRSALYHLKRKNIVHQNKRFWQMIEVPRWILLSRKMGIGRGRPVESDNNQRPVAEEKVVKKFPKSNQFDPLRRKHLNNGNSEKDIDKDEISEKRIQFIKKSILIVLQSNPQLTPSEIMDMIEETDHSCENFNEILYDLANDGQIFEIGVDKWAVHPPKTLHPPEEIIEDTLKAEFEKMNLNGLKPIL